MKMNLKASSCLIVLVILLIVGLGYVNGPVEFKRPFAKSDSLPNGVEIHVIADNNPYKVGLDTEWGFSCLVRGTGKAILFDTGHSDVTLLDNMRKMNITPEEVGVVVLSHIHSDHTGGLQGFLEKNHDVTIYLPKTFPEYIKEGYKASGATVFEVTKVLKICDGVYATGVLEGRPLEQSLVLHLDSGGIVVTGCAHPGIVKILKKAKEIIKDDLHLVMGGFHLKGGILGPPSSNELETIVSSFKDIGVRYVGPAHCSGDQAMRFFKKTYQEQYIDVGVGKVIPVKDLKR
jgi:7,8-dihydropterin-6-yl-methyl-4-(beta-D-ribofuranosyl)aminobenzene 5'-phosphate synthase